MSRAICSSDGSTSPRHSKRRYAFLLGLVALTLLIAPSIPAAASPGASWHGDELLQPAIPEEPGNGTEAGSEDSSDPSDLDTENAASGSQATGEESQDGSAEDDGPEGSGRIVASSRGGSRPAGPAPEPPPPSLGDRIASIALEYAGYAYRWGGHSPKWGFDCSGFTWYVYGQVGIDLPMHYLQGQLNAGRRVSRDELLPGDLVFFKNTYIYGLSHSGIYVGDGRFISAVEPGVGVRAVSMNTAYWAPRFLGGSRPWQ